MISEYFSIICVLIYRAVGYGGERITRICHTTSGLVTGGMLEGLERNAHTRFMSGITFSRANKGGIACCSVRIIEWHKLYCTWGNRICKQRGSGNSHCFSNDCCSGRFVILKVDDIGRVSKI